MDSFILDVLRGWRLLNAASLSQDEWRDVLSTTNNKLDYDTISDALQTLWDEQLATRGHGDSHWQNWHDFNLAWESDSSWDTGYGEWDDASWQDSWSTASWDYDAAWAEDWGASWHEPHAHAQ